MAHLQPDLIVSKAKRMKFDDLVKIGVGPEGTLKTYIIDSEAFRSRSIFFRNALSSSWRAADERLVRIPDDDIDTFELYLHLVYHKERTCRPDPPNDTEDGKEERLSLARLYVLCEKLQDIRSQNTVIEALVKGIYKDSRSTKWPIPSTTTVDIIYKGTTKGSPAHQCLVDVFTYSIQSGWLTRSTRSDYLGEFLQELAVSVMDKRSRQVLRHEAMYDGGLEYMQQE